MKKRIASFLLVLVLTLSLSSCASCELPSFQSLGTWGRINLAMSKVDSYEADTEMQMEYVLNGNKISTTATGKTIESGIGENDYYYYQTASVNVVCEELNMNINNFSREAYNEGQAFIYSKTENGKKSLRGKMDLKEFVEHKQDSSVNSLELGNCSSIDVQKNEDGGRRITCSDYNKETVEKIAREYSFSKATVGAELSDVKTTVFVDKDYRISSMTMEMIFSETDSNTSAKVTVKYSNYDSAERITDDLSDSLYKEIDYIGFLLKLDGMIEERENDKDGSFDLSIRQIFAVDGQEQTLNETDEVSYGEEKGEYFYNISAQTGGENITIKYRKNTQTIDDSFNVKTERQSEAEARYFISGLIDSAKYDITNVSEVSYVGSGIYKITCTGASKELYQQVFTQLGATTTASTQAITIVVEDDTIMQISSEANVEGTVRNAYGSPPIKLTLKTVVKFEE